jgi:hypothetical protein
MLLFYNWARSYSKIFKGIVQYQVKISFLLFPCLETLQLMLFHIALKFRLFMNVESRRSVKWLGKESGKVTIDKNKKRGNS